MEPTRLDLYPGFPNLLKDFVYLVKIDGQPGIWTYADVVISPSGKYCNAGSKHFYDSSNPIKGDWIPCDAVTILEQTKEEAY